MIYIPGEHLVHVFVGVSNREHRQSDFLEHTSLYKETTSVKSYLGHDSGRVKTGQE